MDLGAVRRDVQAFSTEQQREWYLLYSGQKDNPDLSGIYTRYAHLCTRERVEEARAAAAASDPEARRSARHFLQFFANQYMGFRQKERLDQIHRVRMGLVVRHGDREVPYPYAQVLLGTEPDRDRRRELSRRLEEATAAHLNPLAEALVEDSHRLARELGYASYAQLWDQVKELDLPHLVELAGRFLAATAGVARAALAADLERYLGLDLAEAEPHDYAFLTRAPHFDAHFPASRLLPALAATLRGMGLDLTAGGRVRLDLEPREKKSPRAFCSAIHVPDEVVLVIMPRGGQDDYHALFHEAGHAQHFAHVDPATPFEHARLGDISVSEVYAFLFQHLLHDPEWLAAHLGLAGPELAEYQRFALRKNLLLIRRYCGKLRYEWALHQGSPVPAMAATYARELRSATFLPYREVYYVTDLDPAFYSAQYLRAWLAEAELRRTLVAEFGRRWWQDPRAGAFLRSLWAWGSKYNVVELVRMCGWPGLDLQPLLDDYAPLAE